MKIKDAIAITLFVLFASCEHNMRTQNKANQNYYILCKQNSIINCLHSDNPFLISTIRKSFWVKNIYFSIERELCDSTKGLQWFEYIDFNRTRPSFYISSEDPNDTILIQFVDYKNLILRKKEIAVYEFKRLTPQGQQLCRFFWCAEYGTFFIDGDINIYLIWSGGFESSIDLYLLNRKLNRIPYED